MESESPKPIGGVRWTYSGPGIAEWCLSFCAAALGVATMQNFSLMDTPQTAESYYSREPGVTALQGGGMVVCGLIVLLTLAWLITQKKESPLVGGLLGCCALGIIVVWTELLRAPRTQEDHVYILTQLPYRPIGLMGLAGAQVFASYILFKLPAGHLKPIPAFLLRAGFCVCAWFLQSSAWQAVAR